MITSHLCLVNFVPKYHRGAATELTLQWEKLARLSHSSTQSTVAPDNTVYANTLQILTIVRPTETDIVNTLQLQHLENICKSVKWPVRIIAVWPHPLFCQQHFLPNIFKRSATLVIFQVQIHRYFICFHGTVEDSLSRSISISTKTTLSISWQIISTRQTDVHTKIETCIEI